MNAQQETKTEQPKAALAKKITAELLDDPFFKENASSSSTTKPTVNNTISVTTMIECVILWELFKQLFSTKSQPVTTQNDYQFYLKYRNSKSRHLRQCARQHLRNATANHTNKPIQ